MKTMYQTYHDQQKAEIATIKPRTISLNLSDADMERLAVKAALVGLTPSKLLQSFIGDLVNGTYSNGSDERMMANDWFDRCGFDYCDEKTFLRFLLKRDILDEVLDNWNTMQELKQKLEVTSSEDERLELELEIRDIVALISCDYTEYLAWNIACTSTMEDQIISLLQWSQKFNVSIRK